MTSLLHVALLAGDLDESLRFYREALGLDRTYEWTRSATPEGRVVYTGRGALIELDEHTYLELLPGEPGHPEPDRTPVHHIALLVPDVDEAYRSCLAAGARACSFDGWDGSPLTVDLNGAPPARVRDAFVLGPSGELLELYEQVSTPELEE
jgi:glyoxylase I family protein